MIGVLAACGISMGTLCRDGLAAEAKGSPVVLIAESEITQYPDKRPAARYRLDAKDQGVVLKHGDGPGKCDIRGAREALIFEENGIYHLFYDGAGPDGWLACLATSKDLIN